jgi:uncharacterized membrane protein/predicted DsbA family dithiol-disulfide isomerase
LWTAFSGACIGALFSIFSTIQHLRIANEGLEKESFCAISDVINCDIVNASSYSEFLGIPIAWWGLCYYVVLGFLALFAALSSRERKPGIAIAWFLSVGGIFYSAFLAYIAMYVLGVVCIECLAMYVANIILVVSLFIALGVPVAQLPMFVRDYALAVFGKPSNLAFKPSIFKHAIGIGAVFALGWIVMSSVVAGRAGGEDRASVDDKLRAYYAQSLHAIDVDPGWAVWGNPEAKVTIVEFSEYQCPFCRVAAFNVKPSLREFRDDVRYFFVNFPLDSSCNDELKRPMHPLACFAARAAVCAEAEGKFWPFHDALFRNQSRLTKKFIIEAAEKLGLDGKAFEACADSAKAAERVSRDLAVGRKIYVSGTPTIFLNGRKLTYWRDRKFLHAVVKEEIERKRKNPSAD